VAQLTQNTKAFIMIAITGVSGLLGRLVVEDLLHSVEAHKVVAIVRTPSKVSDLSERGVQVRAADYNDKAALQQALSGVEKLLLISSSEVGQRAAQHKNVIEAAKAAGVKLIAYTSLLHADSSPLGLAEEHIATEKLLKESHIPFVLLRNGWYTENYIASVPPALQHGVFIGSAGEGKIASAARADYAAAAAKVLTLDNQGGKVYELAGDRGWTLAELAEEVSKQSGRKVAYQNLAEADFKAALLGAGLPDGLAAMLANSDVGASKGGLFDDGRTLSKLIGRPTTSLAESVKAAL
jgi:NAD(P)H dehydrogenase (quinone)